jgi:hypothetical protein
MSATFSLYLAKHKSKKQINIEHVRISIAEIKESLKNEKDEDVRMTLANAGLSLNRLLFKDT